jgi:hypothetical protein
MRELEVPQRAPRIAVPDADEREEIWRHLRPRRELVLDTIRVVDAPGRAVDEREAREDERRRRHARRALARIDRAGTISDHVTRDGEEAEPRREIRVERRRDLARGDRLAWPPTEEVSERELCVRRHRRRLELHRVTEL